MTWTYQIMRRTEHGEEVYGIYEVYHNPYGYTEKPVAIEGESVEDLKVILTQMLEALDKPVLEYK